MSEFYFKWSKFALKRCNQIRSEKRDAILGGSFEARQENQPKVAPVLIRIACDLQNWNLPRKNVANQE